MSGPYAAPGASAKNGFQLYLKQHGNKLGGRDVTVVEADEGIGAATAVPAVQRVMTQDQAEVLVGVTDHPNTVAHGIDVEAEDRAG